MPGATTGGTGGAVIFSRIDTNPSLWMKTPIYLKELVRYIHLNPLRAGMVTSLSALDRYPWCGHSALMGHFDREWHDVAFVLRLFGNSEKHASRAYTGFVEKGIDMGRQPHLVGGGLVRSAGGWSAIKALRRIGAQEKGDDRILGGGEFVSQILSEAELSKKYRLANLDRHQCASDLIALCCREKGVSIQALGGGSRMRRVSKVRRELASRLTEELGLSLPKLPAC